MVTNCKNFDTNSGEAGIPIKLNPRRTFLTLTDSALIHFCYYSSYIRGGGLFLTFEKRVFIEMAIVSYI